MSAEKDITLDEKRVYGVKTGSTAVFVATGAGLARVECSGELVGEFGLDWRGECRDVASGEGLLAVATPGDVLLGPDFDGTGFGPATAVGVHDGAPLAAGDGRVARLVDGAWVDLAVDTVPPVRAVDGPFVATAEGVFRAEDGTLTDVGLDDARDVSATGIPLVATGTGLYRLGNGWMRSREGAFRVVASDGQQAHAATVDALYSRTGTDWTAVALPQDVTSPVAGVDYGEGTYLVSDDGTFCIAREEGGWTTRSLGLPAVAGLAVSTGE